MYGCRPHAIYRTRAAGRSCHANWTATNEEAAPAVELPEIGYWEQRLRTIGARIDATGDVLVGLVVSVAGGDVWVSGMESNAVRSQLGWRSSPTGSKVSASMSRLSPARTAPGPRGFAPSAGRWTGIELPVREPCIMHRDPGFLVSARVQRDSGWTMANWRLSETGMLI